MDSRKIRRKLIMSFSEKEIQNYIWSIRDDFSELLIEPKGLDLVEFDGELSDVTAQHLIQNKINTKLSDLHAKLCEIKFIGCEVPLEQNSNSTIRADFLAVFPGDTGFAVIELKKSKQTERQAFTELLAYSNHITTLFPAMSRDDCIYILISPMETRITRDAVIQSLTFDNRSVLALIPKFSNPSDITTLKLELWTPNTSELASFSNTAFQEENFHVCKLAWEYDFVRWDAEKGKNPSNAFINQFNNVSCLAAQLMEEAGIHGFTYCSQLWSELSEPYPFTNSLVVIGLNPYAVGSSQTSRIDDSNNSSKYIDSSEGIPHIGKLISNLGSKELYMDNEDVLCDLHRMWSSQLFRIGKKVIDITTKNQDTKYTFIETGFFDWETYQKQTIEHVYCHNFAIRPTGLIRHLYTNVLNLDYETCQRVGLENHPIQSDMPYLGVDYLKSHSYFNIFIQRMFRT